MTANYVLNSKVANIVLDNTPVIKTVFGDTTKAIKSVYKNIKEYNKDDNKNTQDLDLQILQIEIIYGLVSKDKAQELIDSGKIKLENIVFGEGDKLWLNI